MSNITTDERTGNAVVVSWVTLDDGREVQVAATYSGEDISLPFTLAFGEKVVVCRHHRWWGEPTDWEFQKGPGFLRRLW